MPDSRWHKLKKIKRQYLKPLYKRFKKNNKEIYSGYEGDFYLWVDIKFESAKAYLESLKSDPPLNVSYQLVDSFVNEESACLIYEFYKPGFSAVMSQTFKVTDGKISSILLIFDTAAFKK